MALGDVIARLAVSLSLETAAFEKGATLAEKRLAQSAKSFEKLGKRMGDIGQKLTVGVTAPLALLAKQSVEGYVAQEKAMADVEAALKSMGGASGKTAQELLKTSDALELNSLYDGDQILKDVTANLLTFGNVAGKQFDRAQQAALDMATRLQVGPKDAAIQLGKALNDPVKGITALSRAGVTFAPAQKALIKSLAETGRVAEAQGIILSEVEKEFRGAAQAAADATPWRKAQVAIGQAGDVIGAAILPIIKPAADAIASLASAFANLPEPIQKAVIVAGALGAALGPILLVLGPLVSAMAPFLAAIKGIAATQGILAAVQGGLAGLAAAFGPILIAVGAIYLAWKNWDSIAPRLQPLLDQLTAIGEGLGVVEGKAGRTQAELAKDDGWRKFGAGAKSAFDAMDNFVTQGDAFSQRFAATMRGFYASVDRFDQSIKDGVTSARDAIARFATDAATWIGRMVGEIRSWLVDKLGAVWTWVTAKIEGVKKSFFNLYDAVVGHSYIPDMVDEIGQNMARLQTLMVDPVEKATGDAKQAFRDLASDVSSLMDRLFPQFAQLNAMKADLATIDKGAAAGLLSPDVAQEARFRAQGGGREATVSDALLNTAPLVQPMIDLGAVIDTLTPKVSGFAGSLKEGLASAFSEATFQLKGVLLGVQSFGDALRNLIGNLADRALSRLFDLLGKSLFGSIPGFATGTNYAPGGLALVGERGPELVNLPRGSQVIPNHELGMMGRGGATFNIYQQSTGNERMDRANSAMTARAIKLRLNG